MYCCVLKAMTVNNSKDSVVKSVSKDRSVYTDVSHTGVS